MHGDINFQHVLLSTRKASHYLCHLSLSRRSCDWSQALLDLPRAFVNSLGGLISRERYHGVCKFCYARTRPVSVWHVMRQQPWEEWRVACTHRKSTRFLSGRHEAFIVTQGLTTKRAPLPLSPSLSRSPEISTPLNSPPRSRSACTFYHFTLTDSLRRTGCSQRKPFFFLSLPDETRPVSARVAWLKEN